MATTMDLHATILALAGAPLPERPLDGMNVWPVLAEGAASPREWFYYFMGDRLEAVRDATWKLRIAPVADDYVSQELMSGDEPVEVQLFNLRSDPYERFDVGDKHPEVVARLRSELARFAAETGARLYFTP
jgi:arylsulfatase A-like enzyme